MERGYALTLLASFAVFTAGAMSIMVLPDYAHSMVGLPLWQVGLLVGVLVVPRLPLTPVIGELGDRVGYGPLLSAGLLGVAVAHAVMSIPDALHVWAARLLHAVAGTPILPLMRALALESRGARMGEGEAIALQQAVAGAASITGSLAAGAIVDAVGYRSFWLTLSAWEAAAAAIVYAAWLASGRPRGSRLAERSSTRLAAGLVVYATAASLYMAAMGWLRSLAPIAIRGLGVGELGVGYAYAAMNAAWSIANLHSGRLADRLTHAKLVALGAAATLLMGAGEAAIGVATSLPVAAAAAAAVGAAGAYARTAILTAAARAGRGRSGFAMAVVTTGDWVGYFTGSAAAGAAASLLGGAGAALPLAVLPCAAAAATLLRTSRTTPGTS